MKLSHRLRIALAAAVSTGVVLAALFTAIVGFARARGSGEKREELASVMASFTPEEDPRFDIVEFREAHPEISVAVYDAQGHLVGGAGQERPAYRPGFSRQGNRLRLGERFKGQDVVIEESLREMEAGLAELATTLGAIWLPLTLLVGGTTWAAAQAVFRPLQRLSAQALAMGGADLSERLVTADRAEFGAFAAGLNGMLDRLETTVRRGERFSADAAHELRTPLAILRTRLETALLRPRTGEEYVATIRRSIDEIGRLTAITEALLRSARGETEPATPLDLLPLVDEAVERWSERSVDRHVRIEADAAPASATLLPDEARVVLDNLLDNALRYAPAGSSVVVTLDGTDDEVRLTVQDAGPGIPPDVGDGIFERFVRADDSRNRTSGGAGIGLSVCRQIVEGRGGRMFQARAPHGGAEVGFRFPRSPLPTSSPCELDLKESR